MVLTFGFWRAVATAPSTVVRAVQTGMGLVLGVETLLAELTRSAGRISALLDEVERVPAQVSVVVGQAETLVSEVDGLVTTVRRTVHSVEPIVAEVAAVSSGAVTTLTDVGTIVAAAAEVEQTLSALVGDLAPMLQALSQVEPAVVERLSPLLEDLSLLVTGARALDPTLVADATRTLKTLPGVLGRLEEQVMPSVHALEGLVPVVAQLAVYVDSLNGVVADVGSLISGIPGSARLQRRGEREARPMRSGPQ